MTTRTPFTRLAAAALAAAAFACIAPAAALADTTTAELRVLTPDRVLDPGTTYYVDDEVTVPTRPDADCLGPPGGSGAEFSFPDPVALSLLATAGRTTRSVRPLSLSDQFGFGLVVCGIGGVEAVEGQSFWYLKSNHAEASVGADQLKIADGDQVLFYLAPDNFPNPNPAELELTAPARATPGEPFTAQVLQHSCATDPNTFEVTCSTQPAAGATITGGAAAATTGPDGTAQLAAAGKKATLVATRGADIPSEALRVCASDELASCPAEHGERIVGSPEADRIATTAGADSIRARGGDDKIDLRRGGPDRVDCGPGRDVVTVRRSDGDDKIAGDCERVRRR
jgi:hypothetical protein